LPEDRVLELKAALYDSAVALGAEQVKTRVLIGLINGLVTGSIDVANIEVNEDATSVTLKNAELVPATEVQHAD
jgi:hypothetical protein